MSKGTYFYCCMLRQPERTEAIIVDDDQQVRAEIRTAVSDLFKGLRVHEFARAEDALAVIQSDVGDKCWLVICDSQTEKSGVFTASSKKPSRNSWRSTDGRELVGSAKQKGIPNVAYYSISACTFEELLAPDGIVCIQKPYRKNEGLLQKWLETLDTGTA